MTYGGEQAAPTTCPEQNLGTWPPPMAGGPLMSHVATTPAGEAHAASQSVRARCSSARSRRSSELAPTATRSSHALAATQSAAVLHGTSRLACRASSSSDATHAGVLGGGEGAPASPRPTSTTHASSVGTSASWDGSGSVMRARGGSAGEDVGTLPAQAAIPAIATACAMTRASRVTRSLRRRRRRGRASA